MSRRGSKKKYSPQFERDYDFYFKNKDHFTFSGSTDKHRVQFPGEPESIQIDEETGEEFQVPFEVPYSATGNTAKQCFFDLDSKGKSKSCSEPELLLQLLDCKASVNFHIKMWAEGRAEYTTSLFELKEMMEFYQAPDWVLKAVENQKLKILKEWSAEKKWNQHGFYKMAFELHIGEFFQEIDNQSPDVILGEEKT